MKMVVSVNLQKKKKKYHCSFSRILNMQPSEGIHMCSEIRSNLRSHWWPMISRKQWVLRSYPWCYLYRLNVFCMLQDTVAVSCLCIHMWGLLTEKSWRYAVCLQRKLDSCRNAKWLRAAQFTLEAWVILVLHSGRRKAEHILTGQRHMVWLRVGLWGIICNALCILGWRITLQFELLLSYGGIDVRLQHTADHDEF